MPLPTSANAALDRDDIQGLAMRPYRFPFAHYHLLKVCDRGRAQQWLARTATQCMTAARLDSPASLALNLALSWQGLSAFGLPESSLQSFPDEFRQGMAARADRLGDVGESAP